MKYSGLNPMQKQKKKVIKGSKKSRNPKIIRTRNKKVVSHHGHWLYVSGCYNSDEDEGDNDKLPSYLPTPSQHKQDR